MATRAEPAWTAAHRWAPGVDARRAALAVVVALCAFSGLGSLPLFDLDEGAFAQATLEMLRSGELAATTLNGEPRYDKPILIYWLQAAAVSVLGAGELAFRLPSALAAVGWMTLIWRFARRRLDALTADVAVLLAVTSLGVGLIARAAIADALLNLCLAGAMFSVFAYADGGRRRDVVTAFAWMALGTLTKGPVAIALPLAVSLWLAARERRWRDWLRGASDPLAWAVLALLLAPWLIAVYQAQGAAFFAGFLGEHNLGRFADTMNGHGGSPFYYLLALPLVLLPYSGWCLRLLPRIGEIRRGDRLTRFLWSWFAAVFVLFSASATQLPHYMLYGATPLFLLMARHRDLLVSRWLALAPPALLFALVAALPWMVPVIAANGGAYERELLADVDHAFGASYHIFAAAGVLAVAIAAVARGYPLWARLTAVGLVQAAVVTFAVLPAVAAVRQQPIREAVAVARADGRPVVAYRTNLPSFSVYLGAITPRRAPEAGELAFLRIDRLEALRATTAPDALEMLYRRGGIGLVAATGDEEGRHGTGH